MTTTSKTIDELDAYLSDLMQSRRAPGAQVAVLRGTELLALRSYGTADLEQGIATTDESVFSINSMSKAFTGIAVMQLIETGTLRLDAKITEYLDDLPEQWHKITVHHLTSMTSGVPEIMTYRGDNSVGLIGEGSEELAWELARDLPMEFVLGEGFNYVQTNYALLGRIITAVTGQPWNEFIAERQFSVAGMPHTLHAGDGDLITNRASTYSSLDAQGLPVDAVFRSYLHWPPVLRSAAGMHSTAADLANWVSAFKRGDLVSPDSIPQLVTPSTPSGSNPGVYGIGWVNGVSAVGRVPAPAGGSKSQVVLYPGDVSVIVLSNLLGTFPEHVAASKGQPIDVSFADPIFRLFQA